ncbi:lipase [Bosea sp. 685]|uniref:lipase n=1 Tax=Bosea sp. 685 TaxID=3080057 RepID=UPI0028933893|nr:lipase [Bosea sp. 685]WNJ92830.1 lipase [Bosea sp. 685]
MVESVFRGAACAAMFALTFGLGGCGTIELIQDPAVARIRVGIDDAKALPAKKVAPYVVGYALLSLAAYDDALYGVGDRPAGKTSPRTVTALESEDGDFQRRAQPWVEPWVLAGKLINQCDDHAGARRDFGYGGRKGSCLESDSPRGRILDGLGLQIWTHGRPDSSFCRAVVLAFRGTDRKQRDDWYSNFRWVTRGLQLYDQYEQVQDHIGPIIERLKRFPCYRPGRTEILAVGHSLGGGLAQQAAYRDGRVRRVFAFDPSFVTGYYDLDPKERDNNAKGLKIERVYEHGEILAYPRLLLRNIYPPSACDPQIRHIRFNLIEGGSIVAQHSLQTLTDRLLTLAEGKAGRPDDDSFLPVSPLARGHSGNCLPADAIARAGS